MSREKSVLYPSSTWEECEELIKKIDTYNGKVSYDTVAQDYGLKNASAKSFAYKLSTAKQFGLIKTTGGSVVELTELAKNYLYPINGYVQSEIKMQCFQKPPLYIKLIERFNGKAIPNENQLANLLMQSFGIVKTVKDAAAKCFIINAEQMGAYINGVLSCGIDSGFSKPLNDNIDVSIQKNDEEPKEQIEQLPTETEPISKGKLEKEYIQQNYETENGKLAQIIIPKDATSDDLAAISDMLQILIKRRFKTEIN